MEDLKKMLLDLHSKVYETRQSATITLWSYWFSEAGEFAESQKRIWMSLMDNENLEEALERFKRAIENYPKFAEAYNKLATVYYLLRDYENAVNACKVTLEINPHHFGAWHGMGLCFFHLARYSEAIQSFKSALRIQPYTDINQTYIAKCMGNLN